MASSDKHRPFVVILTGGIATGKTAVSDLFGHLGVPVVDTDIIARELVQPGQPVLAEIVRDFGSEVLDATGQLDRRRMRELIFADPFSKRRLEAILHPAIGKHAQQALLALDADYCLLVVPLLAESGRYQWADRVLVVDVDEETQLARVIARDQISREQAQLILKSQASREQRLALADDIIENRGSLADLEQAVATLHARYREQAAQTQIT